MEKEELIKHVVVDDLMRGVRYIYISETGCQELQDVKEIVQKILEMDIHLMMDESCARPPPVN